MENFKHLLQSKTVWASVVAFASTVLQLLGFEPLDVGALTDHLMGIVAAVSAAAAGYFRFIAEAKLYVTKDE